MADPKPELIYNQFVGERDRYLSYAEDCARLFDPTLSVMGDDDTPEQPWTSEGISNLRSLTSSIMKIVMPPGVRWGMIDMPPEVWQEFERLAIQGELPPELVAALRRKMRARSNNLIGSLGQKNTRTRFSTGVHRNLVEGNTGFRNSPEGLTIYPLRSIGVRRDEHGDVMVLAIHEEEEPDPMSVQEADDFGKVLQTWTVIDYQKKEIWRQTGENEKAERVEDEEPSWYWVMVPQIPDVGHYAVGYAWHYLRLIGQIDHAEASLAQALAFASWKPIGIREGSSLADDPKKLMKTKTGDPVVMQEGDIIWPDTGRAIQDWGWVATMRNDDRQEAGNAFAKGLKDRPLSPDMSATAALEIVDEINSETADLLGSIEETGQKPLLTSESRIHDLISPLFNPADTRILGPLVRTQVITGINALDKQRTLSRLTLQILPMVMQLDPSVKAHGIEILDRISEGMLVKTEGMYSEKSQQEMLMEQMAAVGPQQGGPRDQTIMTRGGPQPPQPAPPAPVQ